MRLTTPASSSSFRCREMVGLETPKSRVTSPTVAEPRLSRSTMSRRSACARALNASLAILLTIYGDRTRRAKGVADDGAPDRDPAGVAGGAARGARRREGAHAAGRRAHAPAPGAALGPDREA